MSGKLKLVYCVPSHDKYSIDYHPFHLTIIPKEEVGEHMEYYTISPRMWSM